VKLRVSIIKAPEIMFKCWSWDRECHKKLAISAWWTQSWFRKSNDTDVPNILDRSQIRTKLFVSETFSIDYYSNRFVGRTVALTVDGRRTCLVCGKSRTG